MVKPVRRIVLWLASTVTVVVLLFGYHTSTNQTSAASAPSSTSSSSASSSSGSSGGSSSSSTASGGSLKTTAYTGSVVQTRWGPVQVKITVRDGRITGVDVVQYPNGNPKDAEINAYALPILVQGTMNAQSAQVDMVSGATVTSTGYVQSLQSALDKAGI